MSKHLAAHIEAQKKEWFRCNKGRITHYHQNDVKKNTHISYWPWPLDAQ